MTNIISFFSGIYIMLAVGCGGVGSSDSSSKMDYAPVTEEMVAPSTDGKVQEEGEAAPIERKLIKNGTVEFRTESIQKTRENIMISLEKYEGYVADDNEYKSPGRTTNTLTVRVPAKDFDKFLNEATTGVKKFDSKSVNVQDVTEEFVDIQARLKTKKELEVRYSELLKQAKTVTEMLEIEAQMGQLRAEIESIEGRLKYLQNSVSLATLTLIFYEVTSIDNEFTHKFKMGFSNGWNNLIQFFVFLINIWPFILIGITLYLGIRTYRRRRN
jgi:hypothetical protein